jgi:non-specific serine/threonine protein kinase
VTSYAASPDEKRQVAILIADALTNEQMAEWLVLATGTVSNHVSHIVRKLGFSRRAQIATWAVQSGLDVPKAADAS